MHQGIQVDGAVAILDARGGKPLEAPDDVGGAPGRLLDVAQALAHRLVRRAHEQQLGLAEDDGEDIVELVRDTARHAAERARFLRLDQPLLRGLHAVQRGPHVAVEPLVLHREGREAGEDLRRPDLVGGKVPGPAVGEIQRAHGAVVHAERDQEAAPETEGHQELLHGALALAHVPTGHRLLGGRHLPRQPRPHVRGPARRTLLRQAGGGGEPQARFPLGERERGHAHVEQPAAHLTGPRQGVGEIAAHHGLAREHLQLAQPREVIGGPVGEPLMRERGGHAIRDHEEEHGVLGVEGHSAAAPAREEHSPHVAVGADGHRERVTDGKARDERIARRAFRTPRVDEGAPLEKRPTHDPFARRDREPAEIVAAEAPGGQGNEQGPLGVHDEEHGAVGVEQARRAVHRPAKHLAGRDTRRGHGQDLLNARQRLGIHGQDGIGPSRRLGRRPRIAGFELPEALSKRVERPADLRDRLLDGRRLGLSRSRCGAHPGNREGCRTG